ncbi:exopolysaccharide biosynthesis polyprenyl glycosylphosphotransferase [Hellea balneolensis]|uniref:exopolysaccharide biosynthesis polyprenyl glycosylphosphotransferase n=1 Tax=Hellea balneolensis TaxID=287478 RepID=UPI000A05E412|nr:exopolysaccharide biosynthesis polyprenyl glycosylphosphotransferase [Hellea balneolensis]
MPKPMKTTSEHALEIETLNAKPVRGSDEKRGSAQRRSAPLDSFAEKIRPSQKRVTVDRRRKRKTTAEVSVPQKQTSMSALRFALRTSDIFWVTAIIVLSVWNGYVGINNRGVLAPVSAAILGSVIFISMLFVNRAHKFPAAETLGQHLKTVMMAAFGALGLWLTIALITKPDTFLPDTLAFAGLGATAILFILHSLYHMQVKRLHNRGALAPTIVMLGATESARRLIEENAKTRELNILAIFDERLARAPHNIHGVPVVGKIEDLLNWDQLPYINRIVVTLPGMAKSRKQAFLEQVKLLPNRIAFVVDEFENLDHVQQRLTQIAEVGMREVTGNPKGGAHTAIKRLMDISIGTLALIGLSPVLAIVALMIKKDSPGPVLFKQPRHGFNNRVFNVYKFRSMRNDQADLKAAQQTVAGDARVTKIGRFIRKTSIDELPQLLNVIKGDMSLVGPRPHAVGMRTQGKDSMELVAEYAHRHKVKPGMTGWAQINGSRGPLHDGDDVARRVELDVEYIERSNAVFDLYIMLKTLPVLLGDSENIR